MSPGPRDPLAAERLVELDEGATPGPWILVPDGPDAELITYLRNHVPEIVALLAERSSERAIDGLTTVEQDVALIRSCDIGYAKCPPSQGDAVERARSDVIEGAKEAITQCDLRPSGAFPKRTWCGVHNEYTPCSMGRLSASLAALAAALGTETPK